MRGFRIASTAFWKGPDAPGFGYKKFSSGRALVSEAISADPPV
jgi:hypothetical protein